MTPAELREARERLGLTGTQMGALLDAARSYVSMVESGKKPAPPRWARLVRAYLDGYRPEDWPGNDQTRT